jgi:hypothetical protein
MLEPLKTLLESPHASGAWIEGSGTPSSSLSTSLSPHASGAWIEGQQALASYVVDYSRPTRVGRGLKVAVYCERQNRYRSPHASGAWIEGLRHGLHGPHQSVAPREWGVD